MTIFLRSIIRQSLLNSTTKTFGIGIVNNNGVICGDRRGNIILKHYLFVTSSQQRCPTIISMFNDPMMMSSINYQRKQFSQHCHPLLSSCRISPSFLTSISSFQNDKFIRKFQSSSSFSVKSVIDVTRASDGEGNTWQQSSEKTISQKFVSKLPPSLTPYATLMRLDKPIGTMLLLWPCLWSIGLATTPGTLPPLGVIALFGTGALLMRSSGCIINDIWDRRFDARVERTKSRPLASKQLSVPDSIALLLASLGTSLLILLQFDLNSILLGASSLGLVVTYPAFKRFTHWPQLILGATFNWGALLGWSVVRDGSLDLSAVLPLYVAGIFWTLLYDTIYAHQDRQDDIRIGLKSTAIKFANSTNQYLYTFSGLMTGSLLIGGVATEQLWPYYLAVSLVGANLTRIVWSLNIDDQQSCSRAFNQNNQIGWILFLGILVSTWMKPGNKEDKKSEEEHPEETTTTR